jgi:hypothetical protein
MLSVLRLYNESLFVARFDYRINIGEVGRVLEGRVSKVIEQDMERRLHSDLK